MSDLTREARALVEAASAGPWEQAIVVAGVNHEFIAHHVLQCPSGAPDDGGDLLAECSYEPDAALIARAPTLLAEMADRMERLEAVVRVVRGAAEEEDVVDWPNVDAALGLDKHARWFDTCLALDALLGDG